MFPLRSSLCSQAAIETPEFQGWASKMGETPLQMHRKVWEWCFIAQALYERDMLRPGSRGLGFAVGQEPLAALFAGLGCEILATDLHTEVATAEGHDWSSTNEHAANLEDLNRRGLCPEAGFRERVQFRFVDMNAIPSDLQGFDFLWSSCSLEHLGSLDLGKSFIVNCLSCLRPGGVAVHTTEFNLSSNESTAESGSSVLFRRRDMLDIGRMLNAQGSSVDFEFSEGADPNDLIVDRLPYTHDPHLRIELLGYVSTSFGLIVETGFIAAGPGQP